MYYFESQAATQTQKPSQAESALDEGLEAAPIEQEIEESGGITEITDPYQESEVTKKITTENKSETKIENNNLELPKFEFAHPDNELNTNTNLSETTKQNSDNNDLLPERQTAELPGIQEVPNSSQLQDQNIPSEEYVLKESNSGDFVKVEQRTRPDQTYIERRSSGGFMLTLGASNLLMDNFTTIESDVEYLYDHFYGDTPVWSPELFLGYKKNFSIGSIHADLGYGYFYTKNDISGTTHTLSIQRPSVRLGIILDTLFKKEPLVAPYGNMTLWKMNIKESNSTQDVEYDTEMGYTYNVGLLIQLNWMDPDSSYQARRNYGLENAYLDIFATQQMKTSASDDPDVSTELTYGAGLRFEF